eukprot:346274_1
MLSTLISIILLLLVVLGEEMQYKFKTQIDDSYGHEILVNDTIKKWKKREEVYLWNVVCVANTCDMNKWEDRMTWLQYSSTNSGHYSKYHKTQDEWANGQKPGKVAGIMDYVKVEIYCKMNGRLMNLIQKEIQ